MDLSKKLTAEFIGTFWLVFGGCGSAIISASFPELGIGFLGVALAFGLTLLSMAYLIGDISGCHINPAVSIGLWSANKFDTKELVPYIIAQLAGAIFGAGLLYLIATGKSGFEVGNFASNGYGELSPGKYSITSALISETVLTFIFLLVILGVTTKRAYAGFAPIAIGLTLTFIHLISIPITNTSVNPARSTATAIFAKTSVPLSQLWLFWIAPIIGAVLAGLFWRWFSSREDSI